MVQTSYVPDAHIGYHTFPSYQFRADFSRRAGEGLAARK